MKALSRSRLSLADLAGRAVANVKVAQGDMGCKIGSV